MLKIIPMLIFISTPVIAGNSLSQECSDQFSTGKKVSGINVIANWRSEGPAFNIDIDDVWYAKQFSDGNGKAFYQIAYMAYTTQQPVNTCTRDGYLLGIEPE